MGYLGTCGTMSRSMIKNQQSDCQVNAEDLLNALVAIVNTAQVNPDRCMVDICNDNFEVRGVNLRAKLIPENENNPIQIDVISNIIQCSKINNEE